MSGPHHRWGFGRVHFPYPLGAGLVAPWGWGWRTFVIHQGEVVEFPVGAAGQEPLEALHHKWAVLWDEPDLDAVADIDVEIVDRCVPASGTSLHWFDHGSDLRTGGESFDIAGRCLFMRVIGTSIPPGGRQVYSADYWHSDDLFPWVH